jgi:hypothetical protein
VCARVFLLRTAEFDGLALCYSAEIVIPLFEENGGRFT